MRIQNKFVLRYWSTCADPEFFSGVQGIILLAKVGFVQDHSSITLPSQ